MQKHAGGRPKKDASEKRIPLQVRISPATRDYLHELGEIHEAHFGEAASDGKLIDLLVLSVRKRSIIRKK